jgi:glycosyltransferase involved in cell wall biosynthesis
MIANMIVKIFIRPRLYVVYYDLILQRPTTITGKIIAKLKGFILNRANYFYFLQKDIAGYVKYYSLNSEKFRFVAFKANNIKFIDKITSVDHGYIFSAGLSHRDYGLLFSAIGELGYKCKVVVPLSRIGIHNTNFVPENVPSNIEVITEDVDQYSWNELLAKSKIVVLPIIKDVLQPAGISVCLEAMAFGKPVVISKGTSVNGLMTEKEVELFEASDKNSLKEAISRVWCDREHREEIAKNGKKYAIKLGDNKSLQERLIDQLVSDGFIAKNSTGVYE